MSPLTVVGILIAISSTYADVRNILEDTAHSNDPNTISPQAVNYLASNPPNGRYWWMDSNSPLKAAYDDYKKCSTKGNCITQSENPAAPAPQPFQPQENIPALNVNRNPFLNGNFKSNQGNAKYNEDGPKINVNKNPFLNPAIVTAGNGVPVIKDQDGFLGVQPAQPFAKKPGFSSTHPLEQKKKPGFSTTHPFNQQKFPPQNFNLVNLTVECRGAGFSCVEKNLCLNGIVNKNGEGLLQVRSDVHYCHEDTEVCCQLSNINEITAGKNSIPGSTIKLAGGVGFSPGLIRIQPLDVKPDIIFAGEHGHHSSSTSKSIRDTSLNQNSVFSSTVDYSDTKFDNDVRFASSPFQGPAYLPPIGPSTPASPKPFETRQPSINQQFVPSRPSTSNYIPPVSTTTRLATPVFQSPSSTTYRPAPSTRFSQTPFVPFSPTPSATSRPEQAITFRPAPSTSREYLPPRPSTPRPISVNTQYVSPQQPYPQPTRQPNVITDQPKQPSTISQRPYQPVVTQKPYQPSFPTQPPFQPSVPRLPEIIPQKPYQPSVTPQQPYQPSVTQKPYQPSVTQKPYQPSVTQKPYQPSVTPQKPYQPSVTPQQPYQPNVTPQKPYQPIVTPQKPYQPSVTPQKPYQPSVTPQKPYQPSVTPQQPYQPSVTPQKPYQPIVTPQNPYQPSVTPQKPYQQQTTRPFSFPTSQPSNDRGYLPPRPSSPIPQPSNPIPNPFIPQKPPAPPTYQQPTPSPPRGNFPQSPSTFTRPTPGPSYSTPTYRPSIPQSPSQPTPGGYSYPTPKPTFFETKPTSPPFRPTPSVPQFPTSLQPRPSASVTNGYQYSSPPKQNPFIPQQSTPLRPGPSDFTPSHVTPIEQYTPSRPTSKPYQPPTQQYVPQPTTANPNPAGGYEYPKPTPSFGYPSTSRPVFGNSNVNNQYIPPPKKPGYNPDQSGEAANIDGAFVRPTTPRSSYPGPLNTAPPPGCAAALKCVQEIYCTAEGVVSPVPVVLTKEQDLSKVPTTVCLDIESGIIGKCCRDPNYKDPWPSANLVNGVDDGQYKEDDSFGKYQPDLQRNVRSDAGNPQQYYANQNAIPPPTCGERHQNSSPRGQGPLDVNFAEIPWQAMILRDSNRSLLCGGVIIRKDAVLTAAHCVEGLETSDILIKGGEWKLGIDEEPLPFQIVKVAVVVRHPQYQKGSFVNDLALLILEEKLRPSKNIGTLCLPPANQIPTQNCIATGWGKRILQLHAKGAIMHSIDVKIMNNQQCQNTLSSTFQHASSNYSPNTLCGYSDINQCKVDYGSALACSDGNQYTLSGIYAWDTGCKQQGQIGGYIAPDVEWIDSTLAKSIGQLKKAQQSK